METVRRRIFFIVFSLTLLGLVMIYSASAITAQARYGSEFYFVSRQLIYCLMGWLLVAWVVGVPTDLIARHARWILLTALLLTLCVFVPGLGLRAGGARRWLKVGPMSFQPSEVLTVALVIYLADYFSRRKIWLDNFRKGFAPAAAVVGLCAGLVIIQPDTGGAFIIACVGLIMFYVAGVRVRHMAPFIAAGGAALLALIAMAPYRMQRVMTFLHPWDDPQGKSYQIIQSLVALGSGGVTGVGLGHSRQKLFYLPQAHNDFIFSIIGEEMGLLGGLLVIGLFVALLWYVMQVVWHAPTTFMQLLGLGLISVVMLRAAVHIAVATSAMPTKGLPLPFVSYGGSSLILQLAAVGMLLRLAKETG